MGGRYATKASAAQQRGANNEYGITTNKPDCAAIG